MSIIPKLLKSRQRFPKPLANWDFGDASKIQEGATAVDVAGWTDSQVTNQRISGNLVTNGIFDTDLSSWAHGAGGWAWDSGKAKLTGNGSAQPLSQGGIFTIGTFYEIHFDVDVTVGSFDIGVQDGSGSIIPQLSGSSGTIIGVWRADSINLTFKRQSGTLTATLDNIKAYELNPLTVGYDLAQTTAAAQPIFSTDHIVFDGSKRLDTISQADWFPDNEVTLFFKINGSDAGSGFQQLFKAGLSGDLGIRIFQPTGGDNIVIRIDSDTTTNQLTQLNDIFDGIDHIIAFVVKANGDTAVYKDGSLSNTGSWAGSGFSNLTSMPMELGGTTSDFNGKIFKALVYLSALTATEVAAKTASLA